MKLNRRTPVSDEDLFLNNPFLSEVANDTCAYVVMVFLPFLRYV